MKRTKQRVISELARSFALFHPQFAGHFLCPTCLNSIPGDQPDEISEAHVIPRVAGGTLKTLICRRCNSTFGTRQDKWFGEYLRLRRDGQQSVLNTRLTRGYFEVSGIRVSGSFEFTPATGLQFLIWADKTSPDSLRRLEELQAARPGHLTVTVPIPILEEEKQRLIAIGFLTSAYLLWFRELGYSWALQKHLNPLREQITRPTEQILEGPFIARCPNGGFDSPWIGIGLVGKELTLVAGIADRVVFLPPVDRRDFYDRFSRIDPDQIQLTNCRVLKFYKDHSFDGPLGVLFGDCFAVGPDVMRSGSAAATVLFIPPDGGTPQIMHKISDEDFERRPSDAITIKSRRGLLAPLP